MNRRNLPAPALLCALALGALAPAAHAGASWERAHPRRDQVLDRTQHLNARIRHERREGELTGAQARNLHAQVRNTRLEQRTMARSNGGYITKAQQAGLNQQENAISHQVGR
ncbi:MAG: hypothetical protein KGJ64_06575 [Betaproteobacteria bacterium]|jgi:DNA-directed RNA polymerase beta' subunit|nr:hypothetical protein [Betaproteobacteria bacterium]